MSQIKINLFALLALVLVTLASTYDCPEDCHCNVINGPTPHNHAKCTSLNGLMKSRNLPIHSIDLSHINLSRIPSHQLEKLRDLTTVDLSYNEIAEVGRLGPRVKSLNLSHNSITSAKLSKIPLNVQHLDLSNNELTYLPLELRNLSKLRTIELNNNQINCSCETLDVRNWLQEKSVYTQTLVKCAYPSEVKGKPWLQVKQSEICERERITLGFGGEDEEDNELMMGDAPAVEGSGEGDEVDEGELGKVFMPIDSKKSSKEASPNEEVEGSGDEQRSNIEEEKAEIMNEEEEDGSGSGMGPNLNIFRLNEEDDSKEKQPVTEEMIVPVVFKNVEGESPKSEEDQDSTEAAENGNDIQKASIMVPRDENDESKNTYILLGVILLIVVGLIFYVGVKRCKANSRNRGHDIENPRSTELLNMDKKNLGKPIQKNGTEHAPLITEKKKEDMAKPVNGNSRTIYEDEKDKKSHEPLLNGDTKPQGESNNNDLPKEEPDAKTTVRQPEYTEPPYDPNHRIIPRYPPPKSPRASKQNYQNDDDPYLPSSPRTGRYSPVYSPETGKVKIKLTETPRPKTPMLVTRSKSNAGDIITTPVVRAPAIPAAAIAAIVNGQDEVGVHTRTESPKQQTHGTLQNQQNHLQEQQQ